VPSTPIYDVPFDDGDEVSFLLSDCIVPEDGGLCSKLTIYFTIDADVSKVAETTYNVPECPGGEVTTDKEFEVMGWDRRVDTRHLETMDEVLPRLGNCRAAMKRKLQELGGIARGVNCPGMLLGSWNWVVGGKVTFNSDGTARSEAGGVAKWRCLDDSWVEVSWIGLPYVDKLKVSENELAGSNQFGNVIRVNRAEE
jgi:hypothetical protein